MNVLLPLFWLLGKGVCNSFGIWTQHINRINLNNLTVNCTIEDVVQVALFANLCHGHTIQLVERFK